MKLQDCSLCSKLSSKPQGEMLVKGVQSYGDFPREQFRELIRDDVVKAAISTPESVKRVFMVPLLPNCTQK